MFPELPYRSSDVWAIYGRDNGTSFRIFRVGSLEVRTTQEYDATEIVGAVFSVRRKADSWSNVVG